MGEKIKLCIMLILAMLIIPIGLASDGNETNSTPPAEEHILLDPTITLSVDDYSIEVDEEIEIEVKIISPDKLLKSIIVNFGDNKEETFSLIGNAYAYRKSYKYSKKGSYTIKVKVLAGDKTFTKESNTIKVKETKIPDNKPRVELNYPKDKAEIKADKVTFRFEVKDDNKVDYCNFELFKKNGIFKTLDYSKKIKNPAMKKDLSVSLEDFEDATYSWYVTCEDNNSQKDSEDRSFTIQTTSHEREKEIEKLLEDLDKFLNKEKSMSLEEKEAMKELEITKNLKYAKKRLLQINQDLGNNIKFISDKTLREKRIIETNEELDKIKETIPKSLTIIKSEEYIKNILLDSLEDITSKYLKSKNIEMKDRAIRRLGNYNLDIQEKIIVSTSLKKIKIEYTNSIKDLVIIKKTLRVSDPTMKRILEIFPASLRENIKFITPAGKLTDNLYEINLDDLDDYEIIYHIEGDVNLNKLKDTETILFEDVAIGGNFITGMAIFDGDISSNSIYIGLAILVFIISGFIRFPKFGKGKLNKWKNNDNARKAVHLIKQANEGIKEKNISIAKEKYHKIKEIYPLLPEDFKNIAYEKIEEIRIAIDKDEVKNLMKEYIKNKKEGNNKQSAVIYKNIKEKYTRLPKKYQQKVYDRLASLD